MTLQVNIKKYPTKKKFKEAVLNDPTKVFLNDPSIFQNATGFVSDIMTYRDSITVTNHPKRSWFAEVKIAKRGKYKGQIVVR